MPGASGGAARGNAAHRVVSKVTTPSGPHFVTHATHPTTFPWAVPPAGFTLERSYSSGSRMPGAGRPVLATNPHVVSGRMRQNAVRPVRTFGQLGGAYRRMPPVR